MRLRPLLIALCLLAVATPTQAQPSVPAFRPDQQVYLSPPSLNTTLLAASEVDSLNQAVRSLHRPFYVVIVDHVNTNDRSKDGLVEAAKATIRQISDNWSQNPQFNRQESSFFLLEANGPPGGRVVRFVPGPKWQSDLGLYFGPDRPDNTYMPKFMMHAAPQDGRRPNIYGGITALAQAFDADVWEQIDPVRIAARAEAARQAAIRAEENRRQEQRQAALRADQEVRANLGLVNSRLQTLLRQSEYLPTDVKPYQAALSDGQKALASGDISTMKAVTPSVVRAADDLEQVISSAASHATAQAALRWTLFLLFLGALVVGYFILRSRRKALAALREEFEAEASEWETKIRNALGQYVTFDQSRAEVIGLHNVVGATKALYDKVTEQVSEIYASLRAIESHVDQCRASASRATLLDLDPLREALRALNCDQIEFDTGVLNKDDLFGSETKVIKVLPAAFAEQQATKFAEAAKGWQRLVGAAKVRLESIADLLTDEQRAFDKLRSDCAAHNIPARWYAEHPLSDGTALLAKSNALRMSDPLAVVDEITKQKKLCAECVRRIEGLVAGLTDLTKVRVTSLADYGQTILSAADEDPAEVLAQARKEDDKIAGLLAICGTSEPQIVITAAEKVAHLYNKAVRLAASIGQTVRRVEQDVTEVSAQVMGASNQIQEAEATLAEAKKCYPAHHVEEACSKLDAAKDFLRLARESIVSARVSINCFRHTAAQLSVTNATHNLTNACSSANAALSICKALDRNKHMYKMKLAARQVAHHQAAQTLASYAQYARVQSLPPYRECPAPSGAFDYVAGMASLLAEQAAWQAEIDYAKAEKARKDREEEERLAAIRREEERRRRAEEERLAEIRRREKAARRAEQERLAAIAYAAEQARERHSRGSVSIFSSRDSDGGSGGTVSDSNNDGGSGGLF